MLDKLDTCDIAIHRSRRKRVTTDQVAVVHRLAQAEAKQQDPTSGWVDGQHIHPYVGSPSGFIST
jgi:hypothetical protein